MADQKTNAKKKGAEEKDDIFTPPVLTREPTAKQVNLGGRLALRVTATGRPMPSYQWYLNGKKISGATSDRYMVNKTRREHGGNYTCEVKNYVGRVMSRPAMISFLVERVPNLVVEPALAEIPAGQPFKFRVTGVPADKLKKLTLQWTFNGKRINGAKGPELEFTEVKKKYEGEYKVLLFLGGEMRASNKVALKVVAGEAAAKLMSSEEAATKLTDFRALPLDDFFFNPEDEEDEISPVAEISLNVPAPAAIPAPPLDLGMDLNLSFVGAPSPPAMDLDFGAIPEPAPAEEAPAPVLAMPSRQKARALRKKQKLEAMLGYWQRSRPSDKRAA